MNKNFILAAAAVMGCLVASAQTYNYLTIKQDGKTISLPIESVESVTFTVDDLTDPSGDEPAYTLRTLTFEDADYTGSGNYLGNTDWSSLIDSPQYGGPLLYGDYSGTAYGWFDENNTGLRASINPATGGTNVFWNGGEAISDYVYADFATAPIDYNYQLSSPAGGHNGSKNFGIHNGYFDGFYYTAPSGGMWFDDGVARVIDHLYVSLTSYQLSTGLNGDASTPSATADDWVKFVAIGTDAQGQTHETEITMWANGQYAEGWQKFDLSVLGEIVRLDFNITSSMVGDYGLYFPGYIAYDDIAVRFPNK